MTKPLSSLLRDITDCQICAAQLPHEPRPVVRASERARLLIIGQAPGSKVHASGVPWDDASGDRLRDWMGVSRNQFYGETVAIVPMGFCYPGKGKSGDLPPRPECAPQWHQPLLRMMPNIGLTLLIGAYAQKYYLPDVAATLTATVQRYADYLPNHIPLPHPSGRNNIWLKKNPWFDAKVIPVLREKVAKLIL